MAERRLSPQQTREKLRQEGIERTRAAAFVFAESAPRVHYDFHRHRRHQLLYAVRGTARLESEGAQFLLPPQRAVWIPAGTRHATHVGDVEAVSVFFNRAWCKQRELRVFEVPPLLREMLLAQDARNYAWTCEAMAAATRADLADWTGPLLLIAGADDRVSPPEISTAMAAERPHSRVVVLPDCGHWMPIEQPREVAQELRDFLGSAGP